MYFQIHVRVTTMDAELEFAIQPSTTGKQLFDQVCILYVTETKVIKYNTINIEQSMRSLHLSS